MLDIIMGEHLKKHTESAARLKHRSILKDIEDYLQTDDHYVLALYGLRRTGKSTLMKQAAANHLDNSAYIEISSDSVMMIDVHTALKSLQNQGICNVFIDEITTIKNFVGAAAFLSNVYANQGMRIILAGTDSLGFDIAEGSSLLGRIKMLHTTIIPFREYSRLLGITDIDEFISNGGTLHLEKSFGSEELTKEYSDSAIAQNIQHSLLQYEMGSRLWALRELYEANHLTNCINRVVEHVNHEFTLSVIQRLFKSYDLSNTLNNYSQDETRAKSPMLLIDYSEVEARYKDILGIHDLDSITPNINNEALSQLYGYFRQLELLDTVEVYKRDKNNNIFSYQQNIITMPGLRYSQAKSLVETIRLYTVRLVGDLNAIAQFNQFILNEVKGRILEEHIILELKQVLDPKAYLVGRYEFDKGEFDIFIYERNTKKCRIFEVKRSTTFNAHALLNLKSTEKCSLFEQHMGSIVQKVLLYRGPNQIRKGVQCININDFLCNLPKLSELTGDDNIGYTLTQIETDTKLTHLAECPFDDPDYWEEFLDSCRTPVTDDEEPTSVFSDDSIPE